MPLMAYEYKRFSAATKRVLSQAASIVDEYADQGYSLTLRQLYYQFVARGLLENSQRIYNRLGRIISDGRNAGLIDWAAIEDRTRNVQSNSHWKSTGECLQDVAEQFRYDLWEDQPNRVEVWIEKEALSGVFADVCTKLDVPLLACRGYVSQSEMWAAGRRFRVQIANGQKPILLHFGDHDPSGIDMTRDNEKRLATYAEGDVRVDRLALNMDQVDEYGPPPNPAKMTDSRFADYEAMYGDESWELDALEPAVLTRLVVTAVERYRDQDLWKMADARQQAARDDLQELADNRM